jgi:hypothetical protein
MFLKTSDAPTAPSTSSAIVRSAFLFAADALFINQGVFSFLIALLIIVVWLPRVMLAKKHAPYRKRRLVNVAIYLGTVALTIVYIAVNNVIAWTRAQTLIVAIEAFRAQNGRYPGSLEDLVPRQLPSVPLAKYTFIFGNFNYYVSDEGALLWYTRIPPFNRPTYFFESREWVSLD